MASTVGMTIRSSKANERIDAALVALAAGSNAPAKPEKVRDAQYNEVLRLEWLADTLEVLGAEMAQLRADVAATKVTKKPAAKVAE